MSQKLVLSLALAGTVVMCASRLIAAEQLVGRLGPAVSATTEGPTGSALILGRVVDAATNRPISGATATLGGGTPQFSADGLPTAPPAVMTSSDGYFLFRSLAKGSHPITVSAPGYLPGANGRLLPEGPSRPVVIEDGQRVVDVVIRLWKYGVITGRVVDETGEPVVGTPVRAIRRGGGRLPATGPQLQQVQTDDRGIYRLASMTPGDYLVSVSSVTTAIPTSARDTAQEAMAELRRSLPTAMLSATTSVMGAAMPIGDMSLFPGRGPEPGADGRLFAYQTVFHPSATTTATASVVTVVSGQERNDVDIQLKLTPTSRVSGTVVGPEGPAPSVGLRLVPTSAETFVLDAGLDTALTLAGPDGRFTFLGVPPGQYTIKALRMPRPPPVSGGVSTVISMNTTGGGVMMMSAGGPGTLPPASPEPTLSAGVPITVSDRDLANVSVTLRPGARVSGEVVFEGGDRPAPVSLQRFGISLTSVGDANPVAQAVPIDGNGRFLTAQYPDGTYLVNVTTIPPGWLVRSAMIGGRNAYERPFDLKGEDVTGMVIALTKDSTDLLGSVRRTGATGDPRAVVVVFPADYQAWIEEGMHARRIRTTAAQSTGSYLVTGLAAGDYLAAAVSADVYVDTRSPATIAALARIATRVSVADGDKKTLALTVGQLR